MRREKLELTRVEPPKDIDVLQYELFPSSFGRVQITLVCDKFKFTADGAVNMGTLTIDYGPNERGIEVDSFNEYCERYATYSNSHEACISVIMQEFIAKAEPNWCDVVMKMAGKTRRMMYRVE